MKRFITILMTACLILGVCFCVNACKTVTDINGDDSQKGPAEYVVYVNDAEGKALSGIGVSVYAENDKESLVWFALTGEDGKISFTEESSVKYIAVLANVSEDYIVQENYSLNKGETKIILSKSGSESNETPGEENTAAPTDAVTTDDPENTASQLPEETAEPTETGSVSDGTDAPTDQQTSSVATPAPTEKPSKIPATPANKGNPIEIGGVLEFDAEVKAGQAICYNVYRVSGTTLRVQSNDVYITYEGTTYKPKNGVVEFPVNSKGMNTPVYLEIGNSGKSDKTFKVTFTYPLGSQDNPNTLKFEQFTVHTEAGNEQGVFYACTADKAGTLTINILSISPADAKVKITVDIISPSDVVKQVSNVDDDDNIGSKVTVEVAAGDRIKVSVGVLSDKENKIPASDIKLQANYA